MYINSTVLNRLIGSTTTATLYVFGAAGSIALLFYLPRIVQRAGLVKATLVIFGLLAVTLFLLGATAQPQLFIAVFVLYSALTATVWYCNDMFVSHYAKEHAMGHVRGTYLTIINTAVAVMPAIAGILIAYGGFSIVYIAAACVVLIAGCIIAISQRKFVDWTYTAPDIKSAWHLVRLSPPLRRVTALNFLLQFFYAVMTIYSPLYLLSVMHFSWTTIGIIFSLMLTAFIFLQYPVGKWSDTIGEKKLLIAGVVIAAISTVLFGRLGAYTDSVIIVTAVLFCTRIGASMIEVMTESYFFKQVSDKDDGVISIYRMMHPIAYVLAPLFGWLIVSTTSYMTLFMLLGATLFIGALYSLRLVDIR